MRIAVFHNTPGQGGARRATASLLRALHRNHSIDLYSCVPIAENVVPLRDAVDHVDVTPVSWMPRVKYRSRLLTRLHNLGGTLCNLARARRAARHIARRIDASGYDVVFTDICHVTMAPDILHYTQTPSVFFCHNPMRRAREPMELFGGPRPPIRSPLDACYESSCRMVEAVEKWLLRHRERRNARAATRVLCNSLFTRESIYHAYGRMAHPIRLGVDLTRFRCLNLPRTAGVLSVGGLQFNKGIHLVIDALAQCPPANRLPLTLVANRGEDAVTQSLKERAQTGHVELTVLNHISDEELLRLQNEALMVVFVPLMEPFGLVTIESMACGTPVIASNQGGPREVIRDGETGLLVERSPQAIAAAIQRLQQDTALRTSISTAGLKDVVGKWDWNRAAQHVESWLIDATGKSSGQGGKIDVESVEE